VQLRGMAVDTTHQSNGLGKLMLQAGVDRAKENGAKYVWAKARDSALNFYLRNGFSVHGEGFTEEVTQLPHHIVVYKVN
ncbi:MAG: GNAT family N-acetyltransferase, partial [Actinomycetota bacterium]